MKNKRGKCLLSRPMIPYATDPKNYCEFTKYPGYRYVGWSKVNSNIQCHGNDDASVCTRLYSWLVFVQACLFAHLPPTFLSPALSSFFRFGGVYVAVPRREILRRSIYVNPVICIAAIVNCRCKGIHVTDSRTGRYRFLQQSSAASYIPEVPLFSKIAGNEP